RSDRNSAAAFHTGHEPAARGSLGEARSGRPGGIHGVDVTRQASAPALAWPAHGQGCGRSHAGGRMISHPEKVLFPEDGITKGELAAYYEGVAPLMVPLIRNRPVTMERFPSGIAAKGFMQKNVADGFPEWLQRVEVPKKGGTVNYPLVTEARDLLWLANQNCITPHVWTSRVPKLERPDICVFDLDPSQPDDDVLFAATLAVRDLLAELGLKSWVKTSGSKGFHVMLPLDGKATFERVIAFAHAAAVVLVQRDPTPLTLEFLKADRGDRIYMDIG